MKGRESSLVVVRDVACESGEADERVIGQIERELETGRPFVFLLGLQFELSGQYGPDTREDRIPTQSRAFGQHSSGLFLLRPLVCKAVSRPQG